MSGEAAGANLVSALCSRSRFWSKAGIPRTFQKSLNIIANRYKAWGPTMKRVLEILAMGQRFAWIPTLVVSTTALYFTIVTFKAQKALRVPRINIVDVKILDAYNHPTVNYGIILQGQDSIDGPISVTISKVDIKGNDITIGGELAKTYNVATPTYGRPMFFQKEIDKSLFDGTLYIVMKYESDGIPYEKGWPFSIPDFKIGGTGGGELNANTIIGVR